MVINKNHTYPCNISPMEFSVTRISRGFVAPSGPTPSEVLELSVVDRLPVLRCNARTLHIFRHGQHAAAVHEVIRKALSDALIPYYPLAGRLCMSDRNELQVACSGEGIWFVEASADCTLDSVNFLDDAASIPYEKLLPVPPKEEDGLQDPLVQIQVTEFKCHGFVIGLTFCHSLCDGLGAAQFLKAVGELARGAIQLSVAPEWCRDLLPSRRPTQLEAPPPPPPIPPPPPNSNNEYDDRLQLQHATIDISAHKMKELKLEFEEWSGGTSRSCSTFEMVAALLWRQRTRAILQEIETIVPVKLVFFANCRHLVGPEALPKGFYGNCFFPVTVTASSGSLLAAEERAALFQAVKLIQEAKAGLAVEFGRWIRGESTDDPFAPAPVEYTTLFISEWGRLGFNDVDYGWGKAAHVIPVQGSSIIPAGIVMCSPDPQPSSARRGRRGVRLMTWCVHNHHLQTLLQNMKPYTKTCT